jgi:hypothetical protein
MERHLDPKVIPLLEKRLAAILKRRFFKAPEA